MLRYEVVSYIGGKKIVYGVFRYLFDAMNFAKNKSGAAMTSINDVENDRLVGMFRRGVEVYLHNELGYAILHNGGVSDAS